MASRTVLMLLLAALLKVSLTHGSESRPGLQVTGLKATLSGEAKAFQASYPAAAFKNVELDDNKQLELSFDVTLGGQAAKPQQVMILLRSAAGQLSAQLVGRSKKAGSYALTASLAAIEKQVGKAGGTYSAALLIGDPAADVGLRWELGTLTLPSRGEPARQLTATMQPESHAKPQIVHMHRPAAKTPPAAVSLAFTGLALAPLAALLLALPYFRFNLKGFPSGSAALWSMLFHGSIAALLALYAAFWLRLNLAQTLPAALGLGMFIAAAGYKALSAIADARLKKD